MEPFYSRMGRPDRAPIEVLLLWLSIAAHRLGVSRYSILSGFFLPLPTLRNVRARSESQDGPIEPTVPLTRLRQKYSFMMINNFARKAR